MTVSYSLDYATSGFCVFVRLLFRWKGSIYKLIWLETLIYFAFYFAISALYRFAMDNDQRKVFERVSVCLDHYAEYIPVSWILGFYVNLVVGRFSGLYKTLAWPDSTMFYLASYLPGNEESARIYRRTVARLMALGNVIAMRDVSTAVKKRFPTMDHVINAGFMTDEEYVKYESHNAPFPKYWLPMQWAFDMITQAHEDGKIKSERYALKIQEELMKYRGSIGSVLSFDWISIPLVYTQVVTLAVKSFFLICLIGRQFIEPRELDVAKQIPYWYMDAYFPIFLFLQYIFYAGWLKTAESLMNPLGEDDDDFEMNYLIDRNLQISYQIVDKNNYEKPTVARDAHWGQDLAEIAHTEASSGIKSAPEIGSAVPVSITGDDAEQFLVSASGSKQSLASSVASKGRRRMLGLGGLSSSIKRKLTGGGATSRRQKRSLQLQNRNSHTGECDLLESIQEVQSMVGEAKKMEKK